MKCGGRQITNPLSGDHNWDSLVFPKDFDGGFIRFDYIRKGCSKCREIEDLTENDKWILISIGIQKNQKFSVN